MPFATKSFYVAFFICTHSSWTTNCSVSLHEWSQLMSGLAPEWRQTVTLQCADLSIGWTHIDAGLFIAGKIRNWGQIIWTFQLNYQHFSPCHTNQRVAMPVLPPSPHHALLWVMNRWDYFVSRWPRWVMRSDCINIMARRHGRTSNRFKNILGVTQCELHCLQWLSIQTYQ